MGHGTRCFDNQHLPQWDPHELFSLFLIHQHYAIAMLERRADNPDQPLEDDELTRTARPPTADETHRFTFQVMNLVKMNFRSKKISNALDRASPVWDASDIAIEIVTFIVSRAARFRMEKPCYQVLIKSLNRTIFRQILDALEKGKRGAKKDTRGIGGDQPLEAYVAGRAQVHDEDKMTIGGLENYLRSKESLKKVIQHLPSLEHSLKLYRWQTRQFLQRKPLGRNRLPKRFRKLVDPNEHALITSRMLRIAKSFPAVIATY